MFLSISLCQIKVKLDSLGALSISSGEQSSYAGDKSPTELLFRPTAPPSTFPIQSQPSIPNPTTLDGGYPFAARFATEPLGFFQLEPVVQSAITDYVFFFGKRSIVGLDLKYVFSYL